MAVDDPSRGSALRFDWDPKKALINHRRHQVTFEEAQTAFDDPFARVRDDPDHSLEEARALLLGYSRRNRLLVVAFTERENMIRLISARRATKTERTTYEEQKSRR